MKKLSFADKLAKKSFESPKFQQSWAVHRNTFGPILDPAFVDNYQARVHLTAALNLISSRQVAQGFSKLKQMDKFCETDADKTAFLFFMGVCFEMMNNREQMVAFYCAANEYGHSFYMPYIKVGKFFLSEHAYEAAFDNYKAAIDCFTATGLSEHDKRILGAAYTNLAMCLTMMHRYEEAEAALTTSRNLFPEAPGRAAAEAPLLALRGDTQGLDGCLSSLKEFSPDVYDAIRETCDGILAGTDPKFFALPVQEENIARFWRWFTEFAPSMLSALEEERYEQTMTSVGEQLLAAFPFLEEVPYIALGKHEEGYVIELHDCYAVAITHAYETLLDAYPGDLQARWQFVIVH